MMANDFPWDDTVDLDEEFYPRAAGGRILVENDKLIN